MPFALIVAGLLLGAAPPSDRAPADRDAEELVRAHNERRAAADLPPLTANPMLTRAAKAHAVDMAEHEKMTHEGTDGSTPSQRIEKTGYRGRRMGENVAAGQKTVAEVMRAWMNSPEHKTNILGDFSEIGVARAEDPDGTPYWCVDFGLDWPRLDPDEAAKQLAEALNKARKAADKAALKRAAKLDRAARQFALDLARSDRLELGEKKKGPTLVQRVEAQGYRYRRLGESAATGPATAEEAKDYLLSQTDTKGNILGDFTDIGVGYARAESGQPYWCLLLATPAR